jgi:hypothetical protein
MIIHTNDEMLTCILNDEYRGKEHPHTIAVENYNGKFAKKLRLEKPGVILEEVDEGIIEFENEQEHKAWKKKQTDKNKVSE